ncbi:flavin reductase family protein [Labrys monachus]|uniref:Flavin reductase (DIM6/NTAB) family NADH-FMN oxidoreductase RutF n=1 Tax=Labrys monachus TaxID=217067 RepID=A0ABU0FEG4_9HYPH|nr:flavin reductase family protein [Labrys monachus]MDQ0392519.1 flavin reductase (DIM6/NTAB) family NADH-FMN oxidoreductase RutF [Labrys monachus]
MAQGSATKPIAAGTDSHHEILDPQRFRGALGLFATGVTIVTASHREAGLIGITANSFSSVSLDPPLVLFSVANTARSLKAFLEAPGFVVNVLRRDQRALSSRFARQGEDKWAGVAYTAGRFGAPILPDTMAAFDCLHYAQYEGGDHRIIVGRVVAMEHNVEGEPLLFFGGRYRALGEEIT